MNPYIVIAAGLLFASGCGYSYYKGGVNKENQIAAERLEEKTLEERLQIAVAGEIAQIKVVNKTIQERIEVQVREVPVYRDCRNTPDVMRLLNDILAGRAPANAIDGGLVPEAATPAP